jgi:hypothetical protein
VKCGPNKNKRRKNRENVSLVSKNPYRRLLWPLIWKVADSEMFFKKMVSENRNLTITPSDYFIL